MHNYLHTLDIYAGHVASIVQPPRPLVFMFDHRSEIVETLARTSARFMRRTAVQAKPAAAAKSDRVTTER